MRCQNQLGMMTILLAFFVPTLTANAQSPEQLSVSGTETAYVLAVPVSRLELLVPKGELVQKAVNIGGSTANPRYFHFETGRGMIVSGWFEPSKLYRGIEHFWDQEMSVWPQTRLPIPTNVSKEKFGNWDVVFYQIPTPAGSSAHARAHWVQSGTWIDIHISVTSATSYSANRHEVEEFLKTLVVNEKPHG